MRKLILHGLCSITRQWDISKLLERNRAKFFDGRRQLLLLLLLLLLSSTMMRGVESEVVQADGRSVGASSSAAESLNAGQYALGKEGLKLGCFDVDAAHCNGIGFSGEEDWLYQLSTVRAEVLKDQRLLKIFDAKHAYEIPHSTKYMADKGKIVVVEQLSGLFICEPSNQLVMVLPTASTLTGLESAEHIETSDESTITLLGTSSFAEHFDSNASFMHDKNLQRRYRDKARRDRLTIEQRGEMNARRRAVRRNKTNEERNASQRAARNNLTAEERQEMNARRRAASKNKPAEERQEINARRRARRQSIPPEERQALRTERNACLAANRNTPCAESIAMPCPGAHLL